MPTRDEHARGAPRCPVSPLHGTPRFLFVKDGTRVYRCPTCGSYVNDAEYRSDVYENAGRERADHETAGFVLAHRGFRWGVILDEIEQEARPPATLLDVGAGNGGFVRLARDRGYDAAGVTMSERDVEFARREFEVALERGTLDGFEGSGYDVVSANSVIEHVPDPAALLREMAARVRPGGCVAVTTPSTNAYQRLLTGARRWRMIRPGHLCVLSPVGLRELASAEGLAPVRHVTSSMHFKGLGRLGPLMPPLRSILFRAIRLAGVGGDQTLIARKPS